MIENLIINTNNIYNITPYPQIVVTMKSPNIISKWELEGSDSNNFYLK